MTIELVPATPDDGPSLSRLVQLYAYDFSELTDTDVGDDALFEVGDRVSRCWSERGRHAFCAKITLDAFELQHQLIPSPIRLPPLR
jgi:hypothetical protein